MSVHACEHVVGYVLQGDVDVFAHVWLVLDDLEQTVGELIGVGIVQPYPFHALDVGHFANQTRYLALAIKVYTIIGKLLGNDLKLFYALRNQAAHLFKNFFFGAAYVLARDKRYGTIGTTAVATFANFQVGIVAGRGNAARSVARCDDTLS